MTVNDLKLAIFNSITLGISFTHVENGLKVVLLLASIVYTLQKIHSTYNKRNEEEL